MIKILAFITLSFLLFSCSKIEPESRKTNDNIVKKYPYSIPEKYNRNPWISCWTHSCDLDKYLRDKFWDWWKIPWLITYKERLWILLDKYSKNHYDLIISDDLKKFSDDYYTEYFWCEWNVYNCPYEKRKYDEDILNYVFYINIPQIVIDEYIVKRWWNELYAEDIIQAIKRKDFASNELRESQVNLFEKKLNDFTKENINLNDFDKNKLLIDNEYFYEKILKPNEWLHDIIFLKMVDPAMIWLDWTQDWQLEKLARTTVTSFYELVKNIWINKKILEEKIIEIYWYDKSIDLKDSLKNDVLKKSDVMIKKYKLSEKMMSDRYLRYDELYIYTWENFKNTFNNYAWKWKELDFYKDVWEIWSRELLLFNFWLEEEYYYLPPRLKFYNNKNTFYITNIFKIYKYADEHKFKPNIDL